MWPHFLPIMHWLLTKLVKLMSNLQNYNYKRIFLGSMSLRRISIKLVGGLRIIGKLANKRNLLINEL